MKRSSTDRLMTLNFWRMCIANFLLYTSVYMLFPLLPFIMGQQLDISVAQTGGMYLAFAAAMFVVGPFHAYLGDKYRRKNVLIFSILILLFATKGYTLIETYTQLLLLAFVQGGCLGLATTGGITVAIDITSSTRRSAGNIVYAWIGRLGMVIGAPAGIWLYRAYDFETAIYSSIIVGLLSLLLVSRVYVAFRAPIGMTLFNVDRFLLPRAWVPALNMLLIAFVPGVLLPLLFAGDYWALPALALLALITIPFTNIFVKLSNHCQRGTANTTFHLAMEVGILAGLTVACYLMDKAKIYHFASAAAILSLFFFILLTYPYYKKKRVR